MNIRKNPWTENNTKALCAKIRNILQPAIGNIKNGELLDYITNEQICQVNWCKAFTHESVVLGQGNYERLEYLGDRLLDIVFAKWLLSFNPNLKESNISSLNNYYMSKVIQREIFLKMGVRDFIQVAENFLTFEIEGDVFEAFFGALELNCDIYSKGTGSLVANIVLPYLFNMANIEIDLERSYGAPKTQFEQIFRRLQVEAPKEVIEKVSTEDTYQKFMYKATIFLNEQQRNLIDQIRRENSIGMKTDSNGRRYYESIFQDTDFIRTEDGQFVVAFVSTDPLPSNEASIKAVYEKVIHVLRNLIGITRENVLLSRINKDLRDLNIDEEMKDEISKVTKQRGFRTIDFAVDQKTSVGSGTLNLLYGLDENLERIEMITTRIVPRIEFSGREMNEFEKSEQLALQREARLSMIEEFLGRTPREIPKPPSVRKQYRPSVASGSGIQRQETQEQKPTKRIRPMIRR